MKSMTGYGKATVNSDGVELTVEIKSVNNRFLELCLRVPKIYGACEDIIRKSIQNRVKRGTVDVFFNLDDMSGGTKKVSVDTAMAEAYIKIAKQLREMYGLEDDFQLSTLMRIPDIVKVETNTNALSICEIITKECVEKALDNFDAMRIIEGNNIKANMLEIISKIQNMLEVVQNGAQQAIQVYREKISSRIKEFLLDVEMDETKLLNEVAFYADRTDINEELQRMNSHIDQFLSELESDDAVGRKLDFISQEMVREVNTMCSKVSEISMTKELISIKNEIEKLKEQIRNVE